jgi:hypothetical protein
MSDILLSIYLKSNSVVLLISLVSMKQLPCGERVSQHSRRVTLQGTQGMLIDHPWYTFDVLFSSISGIYARAQISDIEIGCAERRYYKEDFHLLNK